MRKMQPGPIVIFILLLAFTVLLSVAATYFLLGTLPLGDFRGVTLALAWIVLYFACATIVFRTFHSAMPIRAGEIAIGSREEFAYHVYLLSYLLIFNPVMFSGLLPVPLMRLFYKALGARMGANSFSVGIMLDPHFVSLGDNTIVGNGALLIPHVIEGTRLAHFPIIVGSNVTIGARSVVLSDVMIGDHATVAVGAVVAKGSRIGPGEVWAGIPARCISRNRSEGERL